MCPDCSTSASSESTATGGRNSGEAQRRKNDSPDLVMVEAIVGATGGGTASNDVYDVVQTFQEPLLIEVEGLFGVVRGIVVRELDHHSTPRLTVFFMRFDLRNLKAGFGEVEWRG